MSEFVSNENKAILWDILSEKNLFEGIDIKYRYEIKDSFEQTILLVEKQGRGLSLIEKNKDVIKNMVIALDSFRRQKQTQSTVPRQYTNEELHKERQKAFERELQRKQTEFDGLTRKIPEKIDFSDKTDEKIGDKMDLLLAKTIASREKQLKQALQVQDPEMATKWIENGNQNGITNVMIPDNFEQQDLSQNINLKIGEEAQILENQIVNLDKRNQKIQRVSFNDDSNKILNFSVESAPNSIINQRENNPLISKMKEIHNKPNSDNDIGFNFFKMLKKDEPESLNEKTLDGNLLSKEETDKISNNTLENNIRLDIDNLKKELNETNKSVDAINKSIDLIHSKQEEILFILKMMNRSS